VADVTGDGYRVIILRLSKVWGRRGCHPDMVRSRQDLAVVVVVVALDEQQ
jgi:hypothetical protein